MYFKVTKSKTSYLSSYKNGIKSQKKNHYEGNTIKYDSHQLLSDFGDEETLKQMADLMPNKFENQTPLKKIIKRVQKKKIMISKLADAA